MEAIANITKLLARCRDLPGVLALTFGRQNPDAYSGYTDRSDGYNYGVYGAFASWGALEAYGSHPWHVAAVMVVRGLEERKSLKLDWVSEF